MKISQHARVNIVFLTSVVIVVFDLSDEGSLLSISRWMEDATKSASDPVKFLVGTKKDIVVSTYLYFVNGEPIIYKGAQQLSGRVLDLRWRGGGLEPHRRHCLVSLNKTLILA